MMIIVKIMIDYYNIDIDGNDGKNYKKKTMKIRKMMQR